MRLILLLIYAFAMSQTGWGQAGVVEEVEEILARNSSYSAVKVTDEICRRLEKKYGYIPAGGAVKDALAQMVNQHRKLRVERNVSGLKRTIYAHMLATAVSYGQGYEEHRENECRRVKSQLATTLRELPGAISAFLQCVVRNRDHISPDMIAAPQGLGPPLPPGVNYIQRPEDAPMYELPDFLQTLVDNGEDKEVYCLQELIDVRRAQSSIAYLISTVAHFCD